MKTHTVTLRNSFHGTSVNIRTASENAASAWYDLDHQAYIGCTYSKRKIARIKRALCGSSDCKCGTVR